jgi:hypothetical protein
MPHGPDNPLLQQHFSHLERNAHGLKTHFFNLIPIKSWASSILKKNGNGNKYTTTTREGMR